MRQRQRRLVAILDVVEALGVVLAVVEGTEGCWSCVDRLGLVGLHLLLVLLVKIDDGFHLVPVLGVEGQLDVVLAAVSELGVN